MQEHPEPIGTFYQLIGIVGHVGQHGADQTGMVHLEGRYVTLYQDITKFLQCQQAIDLIAVQLLNGSCNEKCSE